jgi:putative transposase
MFSSSPVTASRGFLQAIRTALPKTIVQTCIVHMIRASLRYVGFKERKAVVAALKAIYAAPTLTAAETALDEFEKQWGKQLPNVVKMWRTRWQEVIPFLAFPTDVRRMLYTTNAIESVNSQLRKVLRAKGSFPNEESVLKLLFLALQNARTLSDNVSETATRVQFTVQGEGVVSDAFV